jgi:hypothetical protein
VEGEDGDWRLLAWAIEDHLEQALDELPQG